jgi:phosphatidylinositol glycan class V
MTSSSVLKQILPQNQLRSSTAALSKRQLLGAVVIVRLLLLFAMAVSCHFIPDHNPGDDVLRFDLRLSSRDQKCFCLKGHICDGQSYLSGRRIDTTRNRKCVITSQSTGAPYLLSPSFWKFWLSPLTKWDAARFLNLATQPSLRDPPYCSKENWNDGTCFDDSEEAHAFFPMYSNLTTFSALILSQILPLMLLPPTFEALVALSGFLINLLSSVIATVSLYELTLQMVDHSTTKHHQRHQIATASCLVYGIWNPANIFFVSNYSETMFSACTLLGHALFSKVQKGGNQLLSVAAIAVWMIGSYTRSNGSLQSLWLLQYALARCCNVIRWKGNFQATLHTIILALVATMLVAFPLHYHDIQGYQRHCSTLYISTMSQRPQWCLDDDDDESMWNIFSLYGYTQRKHWNVGLFRYYELKQIPNFLLAAPILVISAKGVFEWIHYSLVVDFGRGKLPSSPRLLVIDWPIHALAQSVGDGSHEKQNQMPIEAHLVHNPLLLGHYAILAIVTTVGMILAHVQISTRMICSSSPAVIWYLTYCTIQDKDGRIRYGIIFYSSLYIVLGVILHVNLLPWT